MNLRSISAQSPVDCTLNQSWLIIGLMMVDLKRLRGWMNTNLRSNSSTNWLGLDQDVLSGETLRMHRMPGEIGQQS